MTHFAVLLFFLVALFACKGKEKKPDVPSEQFFPVTAYLKGELARLDTSLASFYKIETIDGRSDTTPIRNTDVKRYAKDFATLPDISAGELKNDYQITHEYDDILNAFVFLFTTNEDHPVRREDVVLDPTPNSQGKNDIRSIFAEVWQTAGDSTTRKNMLWEAGKNFQVTTITEAGGTERTKKLQVVWNGFNSQNQ
jgi:hypothetical protein